MIKKMEIAFMSLAGICALALAVGCAYRYFSYADRSYIELVCSVGFFVCSALCFNTLRWCK